MRTFIVRDGADVVVHDIDATPPDGSRLVEAARFVVPDDGGKRAHHAVFPDLSRLVCTGRDRVFCVDARGDVLWEHDLGATRTTGVADTAVEVAGDGSVVWVYAADAMAGRGGPDGLDRWLVLDAGTGKLLAGHPLQVDGHGATHLRHPDGSMLLDVGMGQDGSAPFLGRYDGALVVTDLGAAWDDLDRIVCGISPDGSTFVSTGQSEQADAKLHEYPSGRVLATFPLDLLCPGEDTDRLSVEWGCAGYVGDTTIVVTVMREPDEDDDDPGDAEIAARVLVDLATGTRTGTIPAAPDEDPWAFEPLGDGTWIVTRDEHPVRDRLPAT